MLNAINKTVARSVVKGSRRFTQVRFNSTQNKCNVDFSKASSTEKLTYVITALLIIHTPFDLSYSARRIY